MKRPAFAQRRGDAETRRRGDGTGTFSPRFYVLESVRRRKDGIAASPCLRVSASILVLMLIAPAATQACSVCFGASDSPMAKATNNAILLMLGIVGFVQVGFVALFFTFWRRARALRKKREQFRLIDGLAQQGR